MLRTAVPPLGTGCAHLSAILCGFEVWRQAQAVPSQARAVPKVLTFCGFLVVWLGTGRASLSGHGGQFCFPFLHHIRTKTYKTNENNTKQTKRKQLNLWVASHEALV